MAIRVKNKDLAFSSSWLGKDQGRVSEVVKAAHFLGLNHVQLGPDLNADSPEIMSNSFINEKIRVVSIRNVLSADGGPSHLLRGDSIADPRSAERAQAMELTLKTVAFAKTLRSDRVILHLGQIRDEKLNELNKYCISLYKKEGYSNETLAALREGQALAAKQREPYLDRIIRALYQLLKAEPEMIFCIENRPALQELPSLTDLDNILEDLRSPRLKYWHNTGNAHVQEKLELVEQGAWLSRFGRIMEGVSLHDASGLDVHLAPGIGEIDFKGIKEALPSKVVRVLELDSTASQEEVLLGRNELLRLGF